jgi:hypothetical protein
MKHPIFKTTAVSALCLAAAGFSGISWGHEVTAGQSLTSSSILNVDVYNISCYTSAGLVPQRLVGKVVKTGAEATAALRISVGRISTVGAGASASTTSAAGAASGWAQVPAINGSTHVAVIGHDKAVANTYTAFLHCETPVAGSAPAPETLGIEAGTTISGGTSAGGGLPIVNQ